MFKLTSRLPVLVVPVFAGLLASHGTAPAAPLLPDLQIESHDRVVSGTGVNRRLYFATWSINRGAGPMELRVFATHDGVQDVNQRIFDSDGGYTEQFAGTFVYHAAHGHIHFEDFANYLLREVTVGNGVGGVVAGSEKVSFCLADTQQATSPPPGTPATKQYGGAQYPICGDIQGISMGWVDVYSNTLEGQSIPLNGVSGGTYWLELVSDPTNRLAESIESNNTHLIQVTFTTSFSSEINLMGNGQSITNNDATPAASDGTDFGSVDVVGDSLTRTFTIQNSGTGSLSLTGVPRVQISGSSDFTVTLQPVSPVKIDNPTTTFQVAFNPSSTGLKSATVVIANNDANESSYQFAIQGNGIPDADSDGEDDISEAASGTDPNDPDSFVRSAKQLNISTRLHVQTGSNVGIGGFIITGTDPKPVLVRAVGPSLSASGISGALLDPTLELHGSGSTGLIVSNNNWKESQQTDIQNTGLAPKNDLEAAILRTLAPGAYTAIARGNGGTSGIGLIEVYDVDRTVNSTLANISTRGLVGIGQSVMIGGEIVGGGLGANGSGTAAVLIRAIGPSLPSTIPNRLLNPTLDLHDGNGALIISNDDWREAQESEIQGTNLAPNDDRESAIFAIVTKGNYTAIVRGKDSSVGVALIEAYKVQ